MNVNFTHSEPVTWMCVPLLFRRHLKNEAPYK